MSWMQLQISKVLFMIYHAIICQQYFQNLIKSKLGLDNPTLYQ
jgi:hypothetical protein